MVPETTINGLNVLFWSSKYNIIHYYYFKFSFKYILKFSKNDCWKAQENVIVGIMPSLKKSDGWKEIIKKD